MSIWTEDELLEQIATYKKALLALAVHESVTIGDTTYTRSKLPDIRSTLSYLDKELAALRGTGGPTFVQAVISR